MTLPAPALVLKLETFEGPLDLLLHLIRSQELDIRNIPIALVTEQYLACLELMQEIDIDVAADWLVMAATLLHIKSRMLLPVETGPDETGEEADPREELVRRLLEYERFKEAGGALGARDHLGRDVFARVFDAPDLADPDLVPTGPRPFEPISVSDLLVAFAAALANRPKRTVHEIVVERLSIADKMTELLDRLAASGRLAFDSLFPAGASRAEIVVTFLAVLELVRMKVIRAYQAGPFGRIALESRGGPPGPLLTTSPEASLAPAGVNPASAPGGPVSHGAVPVEEHEAAGRAGGPREAGEQGAQPRGPAERGWRGAAASESGGGLRPPPDNLPGTSIAPAGPSPASAPEGPEVSPTPGRDHEGPEE